MHVITGLIFILISLMALGSCTRKATPAGKLRLNLGAINESTVINSIYIWGHNKTFGLTFGAHISGDGREIELPLKPGVWNFKVMAWDGDKTFEGVTRCGISPDIAFQSGDVDVPIHISTDCSHPFFSGGGGSAQDYIYSYQDAAGSETPNQIKPLSLTSCRSLALVDEGSDQCENAYKGDTQSVRIILPSYAPRGEAEIGEFSPDSLVSECRTVGDGQNANFHIPIGDGSPESPRVYFAAYTVPNCEGAPDVIKHYLFGLLGASKPNGKLFPFDNANATPSQRSAFFMKHGEAPGGGNLAIFGDGADGSVIISDNITQGGTVTNLDAAARVINFAGASRVTGITSTAGVSVLTLFPTNSNPFKIDDEVMWHVSMERPLGACGAAHLYPGANGSVRVTNVNDNADSAWIMIDHQFPDLSNLSGALTFTTAGSRCVIQVIRVPNFDDVTLTLTGADHDTIAALPFTIGASDESGYGGILPIRIKNRLIITGTPTISALGKGYPYAYSLAPPDFINFQGVGPTGFTMKVGAVATCNFVVGHDCTEPLGQGGGVAVGIINAGGGGGAHIGSGGNGANAAGGTPGQGGSGIGTSPALLSMQMGASGGHGATQLSVLYNGGGGAGGGIILLYAREIVVTGAGAGLTLNANGAVGAATVAGQTGGGGGAGGSIFISTQYHSNNNATLITAHGGDGYSGTDNGDGGGGGGGRILFKSCYIPADSNPPIVQSYGGVSGGSDAGDGMAGDINGDPNNLFDSALSFCP